MYPLLLFVYSDIDLRSSLVASYRVATTTFHILQDQRQRHHQTSQVDNVDDVSSLTYRPHFTTCPIKLLPTFSRVPVYGNQLQTDMKMKLGTFQFITTER